MTTSADHTTYHPGDLRSPDALLARLEVFYDAVPRPSARTEEIGPFTLFVAEAGWPLYARPRLGLAHAFTAAEVDPVRQRQRALGVPEAFEWVHQTTPTLLEAAAGAGLRVHQHPLLVLDQALEAPAPAGVQVRLLTADDPDLARSRAVADLGFGEPGTQIGPGGPAERDAAAQRITADSLAHDRRRLADGLITRAVAAEGSGPVAVGSAAIVGDVAEIVGVATLPVARRRGLGAAVTAALVADARRRGVDVVFLSAADDAVARIYERVGFRRVGLACVAEPA